MRDGHRIIPTGMSIEQHEQMAATMDHLQQQLGSLRETLRESFGSASQPYQVAQRLGYNLRALCVALQDELSAEHDGGIVSARQLANIYHHHQEDAG
jgi:hypothetical protein